MNSLLPLARRHCAFLILAVAASLAHAQTALNSQLPLPPTTPAPRDGLLGSNYAFIDAADVEQRNGTGEGRTYGTNLGVNYAPLENLDLTFTFAYARQRNWPDNGNLYQLGMDWTGHLNFGRVRPFAVAGFGYQLSRTPGGRDFALWDLGGGVEVIVAPRTSLTLKAVNVGSFTKGISNPWQYTAGAAYWFRQDWALAASVTFIEDQATGFNLGARWGF